MGKTISYEIIFNAPFHTPKGEDIFITGDIPGVCIWEKVDCLKMKEVTPHSFQVIIELPESTEEFSVKFTRGSFDSEVSTLQGEPFNKSVINLKDHPTQFVQNGHHWKDLPPKLITGRVNKHLNFYSKELDNEREIYVWLPEGYDNTDKSYPVIYMHDGENVFDPRTSYMGVDWDIDGMMTKLLEQNKIKEAIVVGIFSRNRMNEYSYFFKGDKYANFLVKTVIPFIESEYRTVDDRKARFLMGSSMGAIISFQILWKYSDIFSKAAGLSFPAFIQDRTIFKFLKKYSKLPKNKIHFFMDHGDYGIDEKYLASAEDFFRVASEVGRGALELKYKVFQYADHNEADWARRSNIFLNYFLKL